MVKTSARKCSMDFTAIQEMEIKDTYNHSDNHISYNLQLYIIFTFGRITTRYEVEFLVKKKFKKKIVRFVSISGRLNQTEINGYVKLSVLNLQASTEETKKKTIDFMRS